ncbi:MAG: MarR family winged helix-turn-helix transcriptional regulator [Anaerotardibacter sp.]
MDKELEKALNDFQNNITNLHRLLPPEQFVPEEITPAECKVIIQIAINLRQFEEVHPSTIAHCTHITKSALSQLLKSLEAKGIITRSKSKYDSRAVAIHFTEKGQRIVEQVEKQKSEHTFKLVEYLGLEQMQFLNETISKILEFNKNEGMKLESLDYYDFKK